MTNHIDVGTVLRGAVCDLYSNLVTRPTGAAVRTAIEQLLADAHGTTIAMIDFSRVNLLDFSCADEIVAKLLIRYGHDHETSHRYVCFRGMRDEHLDAVEAVLERHHLALVWERDGWPELLGTVDTDERRHWTVVRDGGPMPAESVAQVLGAPVSVAETHLTRLWRRRLVMRRDDAYAVPRALPEVAA